MKDNEKFLKLMSQKVKEAESRMAYRIFVNTWDAGSVSYEQWLELNKSPMDHDYCRECGREYDE